MPYIFIIYYHIDLLLKLKEKRQRIRENKIVNEKG